MSRRLFRYQGPVTSLTLREGGELTLGPGMRIEVYPSPHVRRLIARGLLVPVKRQRRKRSESDG